jgi:uncharacterized protein (TIGR01244 family)
MSTQDIYNFRRVDDQVITGGQPTATQLADAAAEGITTVINLATTSRALPDEAGVVQQLGMTYHHIPVDWENPKTSDFRAFETVMQAVGDEKTLVHCAANFRVTAFYSLYAQKHLGWSGAQAEQFRASIWQGSDYPIWEKFMADMETES